MTHDIRYPRARLSPAKHELVAMQFSREYIEAGNIAHALEILAPLSATKGAAERFEGTVLFYFEGWDEDPRETAAIPEIRRWFQDLTAEWPYWLHFVEKEGDGLFHVLRLLCRGHYEPGEFGMVAWHFDDLDQLTASLETLDGYMRLLHQRLGVPEDVGERIGEEVAQLLGTMG